LAFFRKSIPTAKWMLGKKGEWRLVRMEAVMGFQEESQWRWKQRKGQTVDILGFKEAKNCEGFIGRKYR
jgi:hypothetical protein